MPIKLKKILKESPDSMKYKGKYLHYEDPDAIGFGYTEDTGEFVVTEPGVGHAETEGLMDGYDDGGRLWQDSKIVSFWGYELPEPSKFREIAKLIRQKTNVNILQDDWIVELDTNKGSNFIPVHDAANLSKKGSGSDKRYSVDNPEKLGNAYLQGDVPQHVAHQLKYSSENVDKFGDLLEAFLKLRVNEKFESKNHGLLLKNNKKFWIGSANMQDGEIEEVHTYAEAERMDFHHNFYFSIPQLEKIEDNECMIFWVDKGGINYEWTGGKIPSDIVSKIEKQIKIV